MPHVIDIPRPALPVSGSDRTFPIRRIWCVGRNYAAHAREMGQSDREPPFFFLKPSDAATAAPEIPYPPATSDLHHEVELVVALGAGGSDLAPDETLALVWGASVGVDLTRRDIQAEAKRQSRPWAMAKGFDASAPMAPLVPVAGCGPLDRGRIALSVNGETRQEADLSEMIWPVAEHLSELSRLVALAPGDLVMTGTPAGVGPAARGDRIEAEVEGVARHAFTLV